MATSRLRSHGISLVEVLMVIAIISLLVSLTLPAVQLAREASRRAQCVNNERQFGIAFNSFEAQNRTFPACLTIIAKGPLLTAPDFQIHNFMADLLPFLEEAAIDSQYHRDAMYCAPENKLAIATPIQIAICPSVPDRDPIALNTFTPSLLIAPSSQKLAGVTKSAMDLLNKKYGTQYKGAVSDYSIPVNTDSGLATSLGYTIPPKSGGRKLPSMFPLPDSRKLNAQILPLMITSGVCEIGDRTRSAQITDGLSRTIMMSEVAGRPQHWERGVHTQLKEPLSSAWADPLIAFEIKLRKIGKQTCLINCDNEGVVYSFHPEGANFLFADGHVEFLTESIEPKVLVALMTPDQGDVP